MDKSEIALEIVLALIEKGSYTMVGKSGNKEYGEAIAEMYNAVLNTIQD